MIRRQWFDLRWQALILLLLLFVIVSFYGWIFTTGKVFEYSDEKGYGLVIGPGDYSELVREHPNGRLFSLKDTPGSYYVGVGAMIRFLFPFFAVLLSLGGLLSEKNEGTTAFSLSLPAPRASWVWSRAGMLMAALLGIAVMTCLLAVTIAVMVGVHLDVGWLFKTPPLLLVGALPAIGLNLFGQSLLAGRLHNSDAEAILAGLFAAASTALFSSYGQPWLPFLSLKPAEWLLNSYFGGTWSPHAERWAALVLAAAIGLAGLLLAQRRFQRMDF
jgi:ABC-type transport system involved in multi-copper enzyme maturation permease subunit